jgi:hypothetical protein
MTSRSGAPALAVVVLFLSAGCLPVNTPAQSEPSAPTAPTDARRVSSVQSTGQLLRHAVYQ